eukprot:217412_1
MMWLLFVLFYYFHILNSVRLKLLSRNRILNPEQPKPYIIVNDINRIEGTVGRGFNFVVLDENNNYYDRAKFDTYGDSYRDIPHEYYEAVEWLNNTEPERIILVVVSDTTDTNFRNSSLGVISILNQWGCDISTSLLFRESFIFVGQAHTPNCPFVTCYRNVTNSIFFNISINETPSPSNSPSVSPSESPSQSPTISPSQSPTVSPSESPTPSTPTTQPTFTDRHVYVDKYGTDNGLCLHKNNSCYSIQYSWNVFINKENIQHMNGVFHIGEGTWNFPYTLNMDDNNVIIKGKGQLLTILNYNGNILDNGWFGCRWKKCYLSLQDLTLSTTLNNQLILFQQLVMDVGGTLELINVIFNGTNNLLSNIPFWEFKGRLITVNFNNCIFNNFDKLWLLTTGGVTVSFINCTFIDNNLFYEFMDNSHILFDNCLFTNSATTVIFIEHSDVQFNGCQFVNNTLYYDHTCLLQLDGYGNTTFSGTIFERNKVDVLGDNSIIMVSGSLKLNISESLFVENQRFSTLIDIEIAEKESDITIHSSMFEANNSTESLITVNSKYLWNNNKFECVGDTEQLQLKIMSNLYVNNTANYLFKVTGFKMTIDKHTIFTNNNCKHHCISANNTSLDIPGRLLNANSTIDIDGSLNSISLCIRGSDVNVDSLSEYIISHNIHKNNSMIKFDICDTMNESSIDITYPSFLIHNRSISQRIRAPGEILDEELTCNQNGSHCEIYCMGLISCFGSTININKRYSHLLCNSSYSCQNSQINSVYNNNNSSSFHIICNKDSSCQEIQINVNNIDIFKLDCITKDSCVDAVINLSAICMAHIECYDENACDNIIVNSNNKNVSIILHQYSQNIIIKNPIGYSERNLQCGNNDFYVSKQRTNYSQITDSFVCRDVSFICDNDNHSGSCYITFMDNGINNMYASDFYQPYQCYPYFRDIKCIGTCKGSPTLPPSTQPDNPTFYPTTAPSISPSDTPTYSPSTTPTISPTNSPISSNDFSSYLFITYLLQYLSAEIKLKISQYPIEETFFISKCIKNMYFAPGFISYQHFLVTILNIDNTTINEINRATLDKWTTNTLRINTKIECNENDAGVNYCAAIQQQSQKTQHFDDDMTNILRKHFNDSELIFSVQHPEQLSPNCKHCHVKDKSIDYVFWGLASIVGFLCILSIFAFLFNIRMFPKLPGFHYVDNAKWIVLLIFALQIWDFFSDLNLTATIWSRSDIWDDLLILICAIGSAFFVIMPYALNLIMSSRIKDIIRRNASGNEQAKTYFDHKSAIFVILVVLTGGFYPSIQLISSEIFGLDIMCCGLTQYELKKMSRLKVIGTVLLENIPQMIIQLLYAYAIGGQLTSSVQMAFLASILSVIFSVLSYLIEKDSSDRKVVQYDLYTEFKYKCSGQVEYDNEECNMTGFVSIPRGENDEYKTTNKEKNTLKQYCGLKKSLGENIAACFNIPPNNIEVGYSIETDCGIKTHIIHFVYEDNMKYTQNITEYAFIKQLYSTKTKEINNVFMKHFHLQDDINVNFICKRRQSQINRCEMKFEQVLNDILKRFDIIQFQDQKSRLNEFIRNKSNLLNHSNANLHMQIQMQTSMDENDNQYPVLNEIFTDVINKPENSQIELQTLYSK